MPTDPASASAAASTHDDALSVTYEEHPWDPADGDGTGVMSRRVKMKSRGSYRAAVLPTITDHAFRVSPQVLADAEDALMEITRFDSELSTTRFGDEAEFAPLAAVLLRTESASSSQIENVTAGAKALAMATIDERSGTNAHLVAANVTAMQRAIEMADNLNEGTILAAHAALMQGQERALPGRFRESQVWIGSAAPTPHTASFVPPHHERVQPAMADLLAYCDRTDMPVLAHAAIGHAQFETIHPFADGNGRVGRALVHVMLRRAGATRRVTVPVSAGLLRDTGSYFSALTLYREGDADPIVARFAHASFAAVDNARRLDSDLAAVYAQWEQSLDARSHSAAWRVLPHLLRQPAVTIRAVEEAAHVSNPAALRAVDRLAAGGVLVPASTNRRNRVWIAPDVIDALDAFATRAGRRG